MTDDLVERVAQAIERDMKNINWGVQSLTRAAIAECFRLRDMKDAPRDGTRIDLFDGERRVPDCYWHRKAHNWISAHYDRDGYSRLRLPFNPTGWLPPPKVGEQ